MDPYLEAHHRALQSYKASEEIGVWPSLTYMSHIFAFLLIHRKIKVEKNCRRKYGEDWKEYRTTVPWRLLSQIKKRKVWIHSVSEQKPFEICEQDDTALSRDFEQR